jgi:hypothetical protein
MASYDNSFKLIRRAAQSRVPCEWGYDLTDGPAALLPSLAKAKAAAQTARLRVPWHLQKGNQAAARDELVAAFVLGRNTAKDGILISALVQIAIENIIAGAIAENGYRFSPETLKEIRAGLDASPSRGTIAQCLPAERFSFPGWLIRNLEDFQARLDSEGKVLAHFRELLQTSLFDGGNQDSALADKVVKASGGTVAGLIRYIKELDALYEEADVLMTLPYREFEPRMKAFGEKVESHPNLFVGVFFPVLENCRNKEFAAEVTLAMLRAAIDYRLSGVASLKRANDPVLHEPLGFRRFQFDGKDRGFEFTSKLKTRGFSEVLIFVEQSGPSFQVIGKNAGKPSN